MQSSNTVVALSAVMFAAGIGIPIQAALNGTLGARIGNPFAASSIIFALGLVICLAITTAVGWPDRARWQGIAPVYFLAGLFMCFYVVAITIIGPRIGLGNAIFLVLLGQIVAATTIDQFGLFGAPRTPVSLMRLGGMLLMALGIFLARKPPG